MQVVIIPEYTDIKTTLITKLLLYSESVLVEVRVGRLWVILGPVCLQVGGRMKLFGTLLYFYRFFCFV